MFKKSEKKKVADYIKVYGANQTSRRSVMKLFMVVT